MPNDRLTTWHPTPEQRRALHEAIGDELRRERPDAVITYVEDIDAYRRDQAASTDDSDDDA